MFRNKRQKPRPRFCIILSCQIFACFANLTTSTCDNFWMRLFWNLRRSPIFFYPVSSSVFTNPAMFIWGAKNPRTILYPSEFKWKSVGQNICPPARTPTCRCRLHLLTGVLLSISPLGSISRQLDLHRYPAVWGGCQSDMTWQLI